MKTLPELGIATAAENTRKPPGQHAELVRILTSAAFAKASRLCALLTYIVEQSLASRVDELTEQQIGVNVFGRAAGFNSAEDTIVRATARLLRQRLDQYYSEEGQLDPVRITIPKGGYIARFEPIHTAPHTTVQELPPAASIQQTSGRWPMTAKLLLSALSACIVVLLAVILEKSKLAPVTLAAGPQALWSSLFTAGRKTLIIPGDASLDAFVAWEQRSVTLGEFAQQSYLAESRASRPPHANDVPLAIRSVTPMADLRLVSELVRVPEHMGRPDLEPWMEIRYARDVAVADTHDNNLILIGSETFNPWITLYKSNMDFHAQWDFHTDVYSILNRAPQPGEQARYDYVRTARTSPSLAYTHLAFLDNSQGSGKVLIVEGTSMGTTYAALTFLTHEQLWRPVLEAATDKTGRLHSFEVLLGSDFVRGGLTNTRRVALHVH